MPASLVFRHRSNRQELPFGAHYAAPRQEGFRDTSAEELRALVAAVEAGQNWRDVVAKAFAERKPWLYQIVTASERTAFVGQVLPRGEGRVLDIGAGWGQITRPLARTRPVVAVEPVAERLAFIRAAARQDGDAERIAFVEADYLELEFEAPFSAICAIGVLEWAGAFQTAADPQERQRAFLQKTRTELSPGGCLILGIENRIGLKYLLGCPDDHLGVAGVACLPAEQARERWHQASGHSLQSFTYSQHELHGMLHDAGYTKIEFFGAFPDYKLPRKIVPIGEVNTWLRNEAPPIEHNGYDGSPLTAELSEALNTHYRTLATEDVAHAFVPSFFVRAAIG